MKNIFKIAFVSIALWISIDDATAQQYYVYDSNTPSGVHCGSASGNLQAATSGAQVVRWEEGNYVAPGTFTVTATINNQTTTLPYNLAAGVVKSFRVILSTGGTPFASQHMTLTTYAPPTPGALSGATQYLNSGSGNLIYSGGSGTVQWQKKTNSDVNWIDVSMPGGAYSISETTDFRVERENGTCSPVYSNVVKVEVYKAGTLTGPPSAIEGQSVTMAVSGNYKNILGWEISVDGGTTWANIPHPYTVYRHELLATSKFRARVDLGPHGIGYTNILNVTYTAYTQAYPNLINGANYVRQQDITQKGIANLYSVNSLSVNQKRQATNYLDGAGRLVQQNISKASPSQTDIVGMADYDQAGRQPEQYLPFVSSSGDGAFKANPQAEFYPFYLNGTADKITDNSHPSAKAVFEKSVLGRILEQGSPGYPWQPGGGHTKRFIYSNNSNAEQVRLFKSDGTSTGFYTNNELSLLEGTDEDNKKNQVFVDKEGRTILSRTQLDETVDSTFVPWLETYYIYNENNSIRYIISPKGVAALKANAWSFSASIKDQYAHEFIYDSRGRMIEKKVPGQAWAYYCYDRFDRLVLMQDGRLRAQNNWVFLKYDKKGRVVRQGLYTNAVNTTRSSMQGIIDPLYSNTSDIHFEDSWSTNFCFPTTNTADHVRNTYDTDTYGVAYTAQGLPGEASPGSPLGLLTSSSKLILGTANWLTQYYFYDADGRVIQELSNNHLSATIDNRKTMVYDFEGKVTLTKIFHNAGGGKTTTVLNRFVYDHTGRLKQTYQKNNNDAEVLVVHYNYNGLGQLIEKNLHCKTCKHVDPQAGTAGTTYGNTINLAEYNPAENVVIAQTQIRLLPTAPGFVVPAGSTFHAKIGTSLADAEASYASSQFLQSVDFRYDVRGKLASINNAQLNVNSANNDETNDYFGMELLYQAIEPGLTTSTDVTFNGNISAVKWKGSPGGESGATDQRSYKYSYDKANRLLRGTSQRFNGTAWTKEAGALNESTRYDLNGNITSLQRNARKHQFTLVNGLPVVNYTSEVIDNLTYSYNSMLGDQLVKVTDASGNAAGFNNGTSALANDYTYDVEGSLLTDKNKDINTNIVYNHLGKPTLVTFADGRKLEYVYDATGNKLTMKSYGVGGTLQTTTDYLGGFVYKNNVLDFFSMPEGRVVKKGNVLDYQYAIADHQGNTRIVFSSVTPDPTVYLATFEDPVSDAEEFTGVPTNSPHWATFNSANNTPGGIKVVRLNQNLSVGPAKSLKVFPGDKVDMEVWTHFVNNSGFGTSSPALLTMITNVAGAFGGVSGGAGEVGAIYNGVDDAITNFAAGGNEDDTSPSAYLNYILFDAGYNVLDMGATVVPPSALNTRQKISIPTVDVEEAGYIFIYLSYEDESNNYVEFDDFKVTHTKTNIIQYNEYYPFGLQASTSWTREDSENNHLYNSGSELNVTSGWYETFFRAYDPTIGRFTAVDPLATKYASINAYNYGFNNPMMFNDPMGAEGTAYGDYSSGPPPPPQPIFGGYMDDNGVFQWYDPTGDRYAHELLGLGHLYQNRVYTAQKIAQARAIGKEIGRNKYGQTGYWVESGYQDSEGAGVQATFIPCDECAQQGKYDGFNSSVPLENYNCAGLAFRNYQYMSLNEVVNIITGNAIDGPLKKGNIKVWLWTYRMHLEYPNGTRSAVTADFHIVGGLIRTDGKDPIDVYSKNGKRPVEGPSLGPNWMPALREVATYNDPSNSPYLIEGKPVYKVRTEMQQFVFQLPAGNY